MTILLSSYFDFHFIDDERGFRERKETAQVCTASNGGTYQSSPLCPAFALMNVSTGGQVHVKGAENARGYWRNGLVEAKCKQ